MTKIRVSCYIDGFNLYHAIDGASRGSRGALNYLKWHNLKLLMQEFTDIQVHEITTVKYFTAYPMWRKDSLERHRQFVKAQTYFGSETILGKFKSKDAHCKVCKCSYKAREEKESDVNIATHLVGDAHKNKFDQAFLVTNDSDLIGPVRHVLENFPKKKLKIISPPFRTHSKELIASATSNTKIQQLHIDRCLLPEKVIGEDDEAIFRRPTNYIPPNGK